MKLPNFEHQITFIYVNDLEVSRTFYEEIMGFQLVLNQGSCRIVRTGEGGYLGYCTKEDNPQSREGIILTLVTSKVDDWYEYLLERQVSLPEVPITNPKYAIYHFFLKDPDGYVLEIQQFLNPAWQEGLDQVVG